MDKLEKYACKRLSDQIKFFGGKQKRFVSIYAKKPRIRISSRTKIKINCDPRSALAAVQARNAAVAMGARSSFGMSALAGIGIQNQGLAMLQAQGYAFELQRDIFMRQQARQLNIGTSNVGQSGLAGGIVDQLFGARIF